MEMILSAVIGASAGMYFAQTGWLLTGLCAVVAYGLWLSGKWIWRKFIMASTEDSQEPQVVTRNGVTMINVTASGNDGHGIRIGKGAVVGMTDVQSTDNRGDGIRIEE
ncbi:hypothetical protein [Pseudarthrobacter oxydans]|uniref:hypothetical protein n=1 Tax=Pseudarthrobacter oxydans TaxID=1671 RepID=UPI003436620F